MSDLIGILGPTALRIDGVLTDQWGTPRQRAFLGALALHVGKRLSVEQVVDWVWPSDGPLPRRPAGTIDNLATKVRKWLPADAVLSGRGGRYRLDVDPDLVDYHRFRAVIAACRRRRDIDALVSAVSLWRGRFLEDLTSEPAQAKRLHVVANEYIPAHADLAGALIAADNCDEALLVLDDVQADHPLHLRLCCLRITTLRALGRADDATAYYIATRRGLRDHGDDTGAEHLRAHYEERRGERRYAGAAAVPVRTPHRLPPDIVDFAGRDAAIAAMDAAARDRSGALIRGVLVVHGMPGVGKTALAVRWGHQARDRFSGGELFVSLNGYSAEPTARHDTVVDELLVTLGQNLDDRLSHRAREAMLRELLSERHTLVILDNALNTAQVEALMPLLSDCLVVVTSRSRLTRLVLAGAREVGVAPLSAPESKALIRSRLGGRSPSEDRLADLCGGLPLLLNLAIQVSARVVEWPPATSSPPAARAELFDWADDGLASPRVVFDWSYLAQGDRERRVFRRLALLPCGSFSADVAVACAGTSGEVLPALTVLVGAHLLDQNGDRYSFHDMVREYAAGRMAQDEPEETAAVHRRIVRHYRRWGSYADHALYPGNSHFDEADQAGFADADAARAWFHRERRNVRGVLDLAVREGLHHDAWRLAHSVSMYLGRHGFHVDARAVREVAVLAARADGNAEAEASSQSDLGLSHLTFGDLDAAYECFSAAKRFGDETGDPLARSISRLQLAKIESRRGDHRGAVALLREGLEAVRGDEHPVARTWVLCALGDALRATSRLKEALQHLYEALFIAERLGDRSAVANCRLNLGAVHRDQGEYAAAVALCEDALAVAEGEFDTQLTAKIHIELAVVHLARKARDTAERHARRAVAIATDFNDAHPRAVALSVLGTVLHAQGETAAAAAEWIAARDRYREMKDFRQADLMQARVDELPPQVIPRPGVREVRSLHPDSQ